MSEPSVRQFVAIDKSCRWTFPFSVFGSDGWGFDYITFADGDTYVTADTRHLELGGRAFAELEDESKPIIERARVSAKFQGAH